MFAMRGQSVRERAEHRLIEIITGMQLLLDFGVFRKV